MVYSGKLLVEPGDASVVAMTEHMSVYVEYSKDLLLEHVGVCVV